MFSNQKKQIFGKIFVSQNETKNWRANCCICDKIKKQDDLKVLRRSSDLLNSFKTGQGHLQLIMKHILFYHLWGLQPSWSSNLNNLTAQ